MVRSGAGSYLDMGGHVVKPLIQMPVMMALWDNAVQGVLHKRHACHVRLAPPTHAQGLPYPRTRCPSTPLTRSKAIDKGSV